MQIKKTFVISVFLLFQMAAGYTATGAAANMPMLNNSSLEAVFRTVSLPDKPASNATPRLLLIGFDGFTWRRIQPLLDQEALPNLSALLDRGVGMNLEAAEFPSSAASWPSIMTGCSPRTNDMYSFFRMDPETYGLHLNHSGYRKTKALWELVSESDLPAFALNVPMSWPPDPIKGVMIGGLLSPEKEIFTHPAALGKPLRDAGYMTGYRQFRDSLEFGGPAFVQKKGAMDVNTLFDIALNRYRVAHYLVTETPWTFGTVVFTLADRFQHNQSALGTPMIEHASRQMDVLLGGLMKAVGNNTVIVLCSDHGFRKYEHTFLMAEWLRRNGFIVADEQGKPVWTKTRLIPLDRVGNCGLYRWNLSGREKNGTISPDKKTEWFNRLREALKTITLNDGRPVVKKIAALPGDNVGPDVLIELQPYLLLNNFMNVPGNPAKILEQPIYDHEHGGIGVISGPGIRQSGRRIDADVIDIAPTCLYALDQTVPRTMDGRVLTEVFDSEWTRAHPVRYRESSAREPRSDTLRLNNETVMSRLKSLGYIQ